MFLVCESVELGAHRKKLARYLRVYRVGWWVGHVVSYRVSTPSRTLRLYVPARMPGVRLTLIAITASIRRIVLVGRAGWHITTRRRTLAVAIETQPTTQATQWRRRVRQSNVWFNIHLASADAQNQAQAMALTDMLVPVTAHTETEEGDWDYLLQGGDDVSREEWCWNISLFPAPWDWYT